MRATLLPYVKGFVGAIAGVVLVLLILTAWNDHVALQQLAAYINQVAPKINKLP